MNLHPFLLHPKPGKRPAAFVAPLAFAVVLAGCVTTPPPVAPSPKPVVQRESGPVLGRDDDFAVVIMQRGEDLTVLAERYLGDRSKAWWIAEFNGAATVRPGEVIVVPLRPRNVTGVQATGYQTVPILTYHRFGSRSSKLTVTPAAFEAQMDYLAKNGYHVISLARLATFLEGKEPLPRKSVVITIDDGYRSTYEIAYPILARHGFAATVFLYSDFVGAPDALTWAQMKEMIASGLIEIQPHSKTHANLTLGLPGESDAKYRARMAHEIEAPIGLIRDRLGIVTITYAYPYGDVNETVLDLLTRKGIRLGATVTPGGNGFFAYPHMLRRSMIFGNEDLEAFKSKLATFTRTGSR
jgi:peptidoglycan/xylan/chitin deacetylase (PgdA/CDA1 family)